MSRILSVALVALCFGCSGATPGLVQCRVAAVHKLPLANPDALTLGDVKTLAADLKACQPTSGDAGPAPQSGKE